MAAEQLIVVFERPLAAASVRVAPVTLLGPLLVTRIVYVVEPPALTLVAPSVLVMLRSAVEPTAVVSVAELLPGVGSVVPDGAIADAVLLNVPVAPAETVPVAVNVAVPPDTRLTLADMLPDPDAGHDDPGDAVHVHVVDVSADGKASVTVAPMTSAGPLFVTTIVYVS